MTVIAILGFGILIFFTGASTYVSLKEESYEKDGLIQIL